MRRKDFLRRSSLLGFAGTMPGMLLNSAVSGQVSGIKPDYKNDRVYWSNLLARMATPVLSHMSVGELRKQMPVEYSPGWGNRDKTVAYMEAFGRLSLGLVPWLSLPDDDSEEGSTRKQLRQQLLLAHTHAVNPVSADYLNWRTGGQPLVDAAFIAQGFIQSPKVFWQPLDSITRQRYIDEFTQMRRVLPPNNNWVLFAAMVETFLMTVGAPYKEETIDNAIQKIEQWYVGDGWYSDGPHFHFDYYNGYVIQPMLTDILGVLAEKKMIDASKFDLAIKRMQRYAEFLERLISPEGAYPVFGRSATYRVGAFQPLAKLSLMDKLPETITQSQVRSALTAVMKRMFGNKDIFTSDGWLQLGFAGHQPSIADYYSNSGSMYLTSVGFLSLGLPATHPFWTGPFTEWTSIKAWAGKPFGKDYAVDY
jgi:hypothetical protein